MSWRRGFFRLWLVLTVLWWVVLGTYFGSIIDDTPPGFEPVGENFGMRGFAVVAPFVVFALGWVVVWVLRGFQRGKT